MSDHSDDIDFITNPNQTAGAGGSGAEAGGSGGDLDDAAEIAAMQARVKEMEAEASRLRDLQSDPNYRPDRNLVNDPIGVGALDEEKEEIDARSVFVGNVDYGASPEEIQQHFAACGTINRVTILCDKFTGHPKGFAYVEFSEPSLVANAMVMNESLFRGRLLKVTAKRTNVPGMTARGRGRGRGRARGRPFRARGRGRGYY
ncbi:RNA-binding domain-containing protein [Ceraceosorus guamensis]|uniref:RNA-binding domain-containing protein n=1 Tax=Ceraceosorus guamensis TaxID=1522189 RepID=A0A316W8D8_9BASI|nr:RNA-binding domain-containing protein [Ceraceosorus guamensis]PWN45824.1 RNA-binding domain-containing protein [Ceraceosorus guamensis]